ncbi:MAG TPA: translation initiation factor IF-2, partial [Lentisphaeria bacterium]|nr:translation initiation factor IF-2 [Lentisphaeria bacterium]
MSDRIRVYELARELGLSNKELMAILEQEGYGVTNHASSLDAEVGDLIRDMIIADRQREEETKKKKIAGKTAAAPTDRVAKDTKDAKEAKSAKETKAASGKAAPAKPGKKPAPPAKEGKREASPAAEKPADEKPADEKPADEPLTELHLKTPITVRDLAEGLRKKPHELISLMMTMNIFGAINQVLDIELVEKICERHNVKFVRESREKPAERTVKGKADEASQTPRARDLVPRPPVVVFMGHVDHGKTSLQDYIRHTHVTSGEAGGITQHIGASVAVVGDKSITFLDTPGHEAFTAMRARGANATDIAVLVVAANDGVMPQTVEAINHARAANVPIVVAMNKMDLPAADPEKVLRGLSEHEVMPEDWGGQVAVMPVSAVTGEGVNDLLERILLEAEMLDLTAEPKAPFEGLVIEAQMESGMGPIASVLVRNGTLRVGDSLICGQVYGRVRALLDSQGKRVPKALPSTPIRIMGLSGVPEAGDIIRVCANEREAKALADEAAQQARQDTLAVDR